MISLPMIQISGTIVPGCGRPNPIIGYVAPCTTLRISLNSAAFGSPFFVRPARAYSWRCKSSRKLATVNEVKRNCVRVTERGEEAWSINREPMDKNRIEGAAEQGERA
jgi:hypothetical protein